MDKATGTIESDQLISIPTTKQTFTSYGGDFTSIL